LEGIGKKVEEREEENSGREGPYKEDDNG